jgi:choline transport protein
LPLNSIAFSAIVAALIGLLNVGSTAAFNAIISLSIAGLYTTYMIVISLLILKRLRGEHIRFGPWRLGKAGLPVNIAALCYLLVSTCFSFFPNILPVTGVKMNWSVVVYMGVMAMGVIYYFVDGKKNYHGPIVERPIIMMDRYHLQ